MQHQSLSSSPSLQPSFSDDLASQTHTLYSKLPPSHLPQVRTDACKTREWTPLASLSLTRRPAPSSSSSLPEGPTHLISIGAGSKVVPTNKRKVDGRQVWDLHAEMLAVRGGRRWFLDEIRREVEKERKVEEGEEVEEQSLWIERAEGTEGKWRLKEGLEVHLYISTLPCGDASTLHLSRVQQLEDPEMAARKSASFSSSSTLPSHSCFSSSVTSPGEGLIPSSSVLARGRDGYNLIGAIRTKPGRADSPATTSLSCTDKLASYTLLGIQGSLLSLLFDEPIFLSSITIGEIQGCVAGGKEWEDVLKMEVDRAIGERVRVGLERFSADDPRRHRCTSRLPKIHFTSVPFRYSKHALKAAWSDSPITASPISLSYLPSHKKATRYLQSGLPVGVASLVSPLSKLALFQTTLSLLDAQADREADQQAGSTLVGTIRSYRDLKQSSREHQGRKRVLRGDKDSIWPDWKGKGGDGELERFDRDGKVLQSPAAEWALIDVVVREEIR